MTYLGGIELPWWRFYSQHISYGEKTWLAELNLQTTIPI